MPSAGKQHVTDPTKLATWELMDRLRASKPASQLVVDLVAPLGGLLVLRWAAFMEAETEAVSAFNDTPFEPLLPESLREASWRDVHGLPLRLKAGLPAVRQRRDAGTSRYVWAVAPAVLQCAERNQEVFASLVEWVASVVFDSAEGRETAASTFDDVLARVVDGQGK